MKITAIVAEYNPLTNGHLRHIETARAETGCDTLVAVMSGSFTQRGDACVADKYLRATVAVRLGVDIVVELPTVYAISSADNFAYGALKTLSAFPKIDYLSFGSECGDAELLERAADFIMNEPQEVSERIKLNLKAGNNFAKARADAFDEYFEGKEDCKNMISVFDKPNNVLGISYIVAIKKLGLNIKVHTVKRDSDFNSDEIEVANPSATAVREALAKGNLPAVKGAVPAPMYNVLEQYRPNPSALGDLVLFKVKSMSGHALEGYYDVAGGLHNRLKLAAIDATAYTELLEKTKTKAYTMAHIKRVCLYALFDITKEEYAKCLTAPPYVFILALNKSRKDILSELSLNCPNVLIRYADISTVDKSLRFMIKLDFTAQGTLNLINKSSYYNKKMLLI